MTKHVSSVLAAHLLLLFLAVITVRPIAAGPHPTEPIATARHAVAEARERGAIPGAAAAVALDGELIWSEGFGHADLEHQVPATSTTRFGLGSVTKILTMALCARLADAELLDLDAPIERYLPDFPHAGTGMTVRMIGTHMSGLDGAMDDELFRSTEGFESTAQTLERIYTYPLAAEPGTRYRYGTATFTVIAGVVERVTGESFPAAMARFVTGPLGMTHTVPNDPRAIIPGRTAFYERSEDGQIRHAPYRDPSFKWGGAGYLSTTEDLATFGMALFEDGFLSPAMRTEFFRPHTLSDGTPACHGLGWDADTDSWFRPCFVKTGGGLGIQSLLALWPDQQLVIVLLTNRTNSPVGWELAESIAETFVGTPAMDE